MNKEIIVLLDNLRSAYNVGSIARTAESVGIEKIYTSGITPELLSKKVVKTALGAEHNIVSKHFPFEGEVDINNRYNSTNTAINYLKNKGYYIIAIEQANNSINPFQTDKLYWNTELSEHKGIVFIFGNETEGISKETLSIVNSIIELPMYGKKESLNVSVAAGIVLYQFNENLLS